MDQKLTEEQQRSAHKVIVANRGDCGTSSNPILKCLKCPNSFTNSGSNCFGCKIELDDFQLNLAFQAENLRRSQAWLDTHITDAEIMAESPREFCERMVRTDGLEKCFAMIKGNGSLCKTCVLSVNECPCNPNECLSRAKAYLASHPATPQEPPKRRPTPDEMVVGAPVRVRLWDELVRDGESHTNNAIYFQKSNISFVSDMKQFCGNTYKIIKRFNNPLRVYLEICGADFGQWKFTPEMLDYVEPEKVVEPEPVADTPTPDALRIITLEGQVDDLTKKLAASKKLCERQQRRLRANWEAKRDEEMATREEIEAWFDAGNGSVSLAGEKSKIIPKGHSSWIPATRGNLKL